MKKVIFLVFLIIIAGSTLFVFGMLRRPETMTIKNNQEPGQTSIIPMTISSPAFQNGEAIPKKYTCDGAGVNPPLNISDVPKAAQSLALIIDDPDAPGATWTHWVVWNINPATTQITENSVPGGATQGQGSSGLYVYGALCPPSPVPGSGRDGTHHYYFRLYALPMKLAISSFSDVSVLHKVMDGNVIGEAELMGTYGR